MAYTFTTLKQAIQDYTENTETTFVNNLSRFIQNAEERLYRTVQIPSLRRVVDSTLVNGQRFLNKPANFQYRYSIAVKESDGDYVFLLDKDPINDRSNLDSELASSSSIISEDFFIKYSDCSRESLSKSRFFLLDLLLIKPAVSINSNV